MKMTEFRSTQPLSDDDLSAIRANVMVKIGAQSQRRGIPLFVRLAVAALLVVAIGISFIVRRSTPTSLVINKPHVVTPVAMPQVTTTIETARVALPSNAVQSAKSSIPKSAPPVAHAIYQPKHRPPQNPEYQTIRMEIRTPDPDVRIIWIANQTPTTTGGNS